MAPDAASIRTSHRWTAWWPIMTYGCAVLPGAAEITHGRDDLSGSSPLIFNHAALIDDRRKACQPVPPVNAGHAGGPGGRSRPHRRHGCRETRVPEDALPPR